MCYLESIIEIVKKEGDVIVHEMKVKIFLKAEDISVFHGMMDDEGNQSCTLIAMFNGETYTVCEKYEVIKQKINKMMKNKENELLIKNQS